MKTFNRRTVSFHFGLALGILLSCATPRLATADPTNVPHAGQTVRVLSIGNSFSRNATRFLDDLAQAGGHNLVHESIVVGGASLELHANKSLTHERDATAKEGLYANGKSLIQMLQSDRWDVVTIQQASIKSHDMSTYQPYADSLAELIRQHAPDAQLMIHQTWAYRVDDPRFARTSPRPGEPATQAEMYQGLRAAYRQIADQLDAGIIPVGDAFYLADTDGVWGFRVDTAFDSAAAQSPALPDQTHSLHVGWRWRTAGDSTRQLAYDGHHANTAGEYLGACVWYEVLFGESVVGNSFVPAGLDRGYAQFLQQTAHRAATKSNAAREEAAKSAVQVGR